MKNPNGYGNITKLSGNRRRPYWVRITAGWELTPAGKAKQINHTLGFYETRAAAMIALAAYHSSPVDLTKRGITFAEVFALWSARHFDKYPSSRATLTPVFNNYCQPLHNMPMESIRAAHLQSVLDDHSALSSTSLHRIKHVIKNTFKYCLENDILQKDYSAFISISAEQSKPKAENFFTASELNKIMQAQPDNIILSLLHTGMRIGELFSLKASDVHLSERYIEVHGTKTKNADRIVPIHKDLIPVLERQLAQGGAYLFQNSRGNKLDYSAYTKRIFKPFMESLGLQQTPHATRHTFISLMDSAGVNSVALKRIVGHSNKAVTEHYTHKEINELIQAIDKLQLVTYV